MRRYDIAVVGQGLIGSAALDALLRYGADAIGFDPLGPGAETGSSHGSSRVFRRFNFENKNYTELSDEAFSGWERLANESRQQLLIPSPVLEAGPQGSDVIRASREAVGAFGLKPPPLLNGREVNAMFPAFQLPHGWDAVVQDGGAILLAQLALTALRSRAKAVGRVVGCAITRLEDGGDHVLIQTPTETIRANRAILALGPWTAKFLPELSQILEVTRQTVGWFKPAWPDTTKLNVFPIFLLAISEDNLIYGFPDFEGRGVKAAPHNLGPVTDSDAWALPPNNDELRPVSKALADFVPGAAGPITERDICLYTNTKPADRRPDKGNEFIIDRWPNSNLIVASSCSGHGAKFAPAIGERLARLALDPTYRTEPFFRLSRYSAFPVDRDLGG